MKYHEGDILDLGSGITWRLSARMAAILSRPARKPHSCQIRLFSHLRAQRSEP